MIDIDKRTLVEGGFLKEYECARLEAYKSGNPSRLNKLRLGLGEDNFHRLECVSKARYKKIQRCTKLIRQMTSKGEAVFITLTFNNETLQKFGFKSLRRKVSFILRKTCSMYFSNVDFGDRDKNPESKERIHYHGVAIIKDEKELRRYWNKNSGFLNLKPIGLNEKDQKKVSKYISKVTAHGFKDSTRQYRFIYYRKTYPIPFVESSN